MSIVFGSGKTGASYVPGTGSSKAAANGSQNQRPSPSAALPVHWSYPAIIAATGVPQHVPPMYVPQGCTVRLRANNGKPTGNAGVVFAANNSAALANGMGTPLAPLDDIAWPASDLSRLMISGAAGDGVVVSIISNGLGNS